MISANSWILCTGAVLTSIRKYEHPHFIKLGYSRSATMKYPASWSASITISPAERSPEPEDQVRIIFVMGKVLGLVACIRY